MPDARVESAIAHWAPRMTTQGIDLNDFTRTTARIETWDEWLGDWVRTGELHLELAREAESEDRTRTAGEAFVRAALCFHFAKYVWVVDPARNREVTLRARDALAEAHRLLDPSARRIEAPIPGGGVIVANLRLPARRRSLTARDPDPRARFDQGGVLQLRAGLPRSRARDPVARRARVRGRPASSRRSATTTRWRWRRRSRRSPTNPGSTSSGSAPPGSASAATTRRARPPSSRG